MADESPIATPPDHMGVVYPSYPDKLAPANTVEYQLTVEQLEAAQKIAGSHKWSVTALGPSTASLSSEGVVLLATYAGGVLTLSIQELPWTIDASRVFSEIQSWMQ